MSWDDPIFSGTHSKWHWAVSCREIRHLGKLVAAHFARHYLCITAFDSGTIQPSPEELEIGWSLVDEVMVSPPLTPDLAIPNDQFDEWYIVEQRPTSFIPIHPFVNYMHFNLAEPREMAASFDSTWERSGLDSLYPLQDAFWHQIELINPKAYVASGASDIVVSTDRAFVDRFLDLAHRTMT